MKTINEIKTPNTDDVIKYILLSVEPVCEMTKPDGVFKRGEGIVPYIGETMFRQTIRTIVVISNGQSFENVTFSELPESEKDSFFKAGFFQKNGDIWLEIEDKEYYSYL